MSGSGRCDPTARSFGTSAWGAPALSGGGALWGSWLRRGRPRPYRTHRGNAAHQDPLLQDAPPPLPLTSQWGEPLRREATGLRRGSRVAAGAGGRAHHPCTGVSLRRGWWCEAEGPATFALPILTCVRADSRQGFCEDTVSEFSQSFFRSREQRFRACSAPSLTHPTTPAGTHVGDSDCVGGVLARSCSGADFRQPEIPRRARGPI